MNQKNWNLAGTTLDDDVAVFADGSGLLRIGLGGSGIGLGFEMVLFVRHGSTRSLTHRFNSTGSEEWESVYVSGVGEWGRRRQRLWGRIWIYSIPFLYFE